MENPRLKVKRRVVQRTKVDQSNLVAVSKLDGISSSDHYVTNLRESIWVSVEIHQGVTIVGRLVTLLEIVRIATIAASLAI